MRANACHKGHPSDGNKLYFMAFNTERLRVRGEQTFEGI
jgi:hypothetical protein